jgi:hypothetical protein
MATVCDRNPCMRAIVLRGGAFRQDRITIGAVRIAVVVLIVASSVFAGTKRLADVGRLARELVRQDLETRRATLFGPWYVAVQQLRRDTPADATIDFVMLRPEARDIAVLGAAELQPRDVRLFDGWDAWKQRRRAELLHDARAANAVAAAPPPSPARFVVVVDPTAQPPLHLLQEAPR